MALVSWSAGLGSTTCASVSANSRVCSPVSSTPASGSVIVRRVDSDESDYCCRFSFCVGFAEVSPKARTTTTAVIETATITRAIKMMSIASFVESKRDASPGFQYYNKVLPKRGNQK